MRVSFRPAWDGFAFTNAFVNQIKIIGLPITETKGRCGGMAFAALDHWHRRLPVPDAGTLPADGNPVADYIYDRLITSIMDNWAMYAQFMSTPDHPTTLRGIGVARMTREEQFPKLKQLLDQGLPQPLGLVQSRDPAGFGNDHQVVAYGYEQDATRTRIFIWDNRFRRREDVLEFKTAYDPADRAVRQSNGDEWRGFFVERYSPRTPWYLSAGKLLSDRSDPRIYVVHGGAKFWVTSPQEFDRLGLRWTEVVELPDGSTAYVADRPGDRLLLREIDRPEVYVTYGGHGFHIPDPDTLIRLGFTWSDVRVVPRDSLRALTPVPIDGTALREEHKDPVYLVSGGALHHVPDPTTFTALGLRWDRVGVVPDGALAKLPMGDPLPTSHLPAWSELPAGQLITRDHDAVDYRIEAGAKPADEVEFVLTLGSGLTWRKEIGLHAKDGDWTIAVQDAKRTDANGLYRYQLPEGQLRLRKAKLFGAVTGVLELNDLDRLPAGARVTFTWVRD
ncbi:hypothetical protein ONA91_20000 [Micromonospora sp. DR5-3]|uniref:hypothetical protein n=1 Tax=unclassified Micromonospora TaxID=2617518 RepID=UPI0011D7C492|nr:MULTISPECIES: hypothetical protein [unclassified Micromonospora]MCW3816733.1 hypothetical protein [Micromonospora sp. DR5-3]TYC20687.1 hypothetical protein FXF52_30005 [Micromonospora sp. MP36]